jgi:two-component system, NarL family, sensor kinase
MVHHSFEAAMARKRDCCTRLGATDLTIDTANELMDTKSMTAHPKLSHSSSAAASSEPHLQSAIAAVVLIDESGGIVDITADAAAMLGYEPQALLGSTLTDLAAPGWKAVAEDVIACIRSGTTDLPELMLRGRSGRRTMVQMRARELDSPARAAGTHVVAWSQRAQRTNGNGSSCENDEKLRRLAYGLLTNHEEERSRVAAELHDGVVPLVFMAKLMIEDGLLRMKSGSQVQAGEALVRALDRLRDVSSEVRRISTELRPRMLDDLGLLPTIEWYCRTFRETCAATRLERRLAADEARIVAPLKLEIFRILQEALNNVAQHSAARRALVVLVQEGAELRLTIEDDGVGFDSAQLSEGDSRLPGLGLQSIRKRICATGGRLILQTKPGAGTTIGAVWPL